MRIVGAVSHEHVVAPGVPAGGCVGGEVVATLEGDAVAEAGDWVVTDDQGVTWPVMAGVFESS